MQFKDLFSAGKPLIACVHLLPLPGSPRYTGDMDAVYENALAEARIFKRQGVDGLVVENFRDMPFYPDRVPAETVAALAAVSREVKKATDLPLGINVLRNDAQSAIAIAAAVQADFIRVNVHCGAAVADQGVLQGVAYATLRLRSTLRSEVLIFADAGVKHTTPLGPRSLGLEAKDLTKRGLADAVVVSGAATGSETRADDLDLVRQNTHLPVLVGSGATPENLEHLFPRADGFIVGSYFKKDGKAENLVEEVRVKTFVERFKALRE